MPLLSGRIVRLLVGIAVVLLLLLVWPNLFAAIGSFLKATLGPFFLAALISYFLYPFVARLSAYGCPRTLAILLVYLCVLGCSGLLFWLTWPAVGQQLQGLLVQLPRWNEQLVEWVEGYRVQARELLPSLIWDGIERSLVRMEAGAVGWVEGFLASVTTMTDMLFLVLMVPLLSFYMLKDARLIQRAGLRLVPPAQRQFCLRLLHDVDRVLGHYIRGQFLIGSIVFAATYVGYLVIQLPSALLLALLVGVANVVPYLGPLLGAFPALVVASLSAPSSVGLVIGINLLVQILESNVVSPHVMGQTLHLHPLWIILALLIGGELAGILGLIVAVPLAAMANVIADNLLAHRLRRRPSPEEELSTLHR